jgi:antitoxin component YwqK of YwqJK toxin-antitoxin module
MRASLVALLLCPMAFAQAQRPDTVRVKSGGVDKYIVGIHTKKGVYSGHVEYFDTTWTLRQKGNAIKGKWEGPIEYFDSTGTLLRRSLAKKGKLEGMTTDYRSNGLVWRETPMHKGKVHGEFKQYHANGMLELKAPYRDGKMSGETIVWDSTGAKANGDVVITGTGGASFKFHCVDGHPEGKMVGKRKDGQFTVIGMFSAGLPTGDFIYYDTNGTPVRKDTYKDGRCMKSVPLNEFP